MKAGTAPDEARGLRLFLEDLTAVPWGWWLLLAFLFVGGMWKTYDDWKTHQLVKQWEAQGREVAR